MPGQAGAAHGGWCGTDAAYCALPSSEAAAMPPWHFFSSLTPAPLSLRLHGKGAAAWVGWGHGGRCHSSQHASPVRRCCNAWARGCNHACKQRHTDAAPRQHQRCRARPHLRLWRCGWDSMLASLEAWDRSWPSSSAAAAAAAAGGAAGGVSGLRRQATVCGSTAGNCMQ